MKRVWAILLIVIPIYGLASGCQSAGLSQAELENVIDNLGQPVPFDSVYAVLKRMPRVQGEYETKTQFKSRQEAAAKELQDQYLISTPIDLNYAEYDADAGKLNISIYAFQNGVPSRAELDRLFGWSSEIRRQGIDVDYGRNVLNSGAIQWVFLREIRTIGGYEGQNAFGATRNVATQSGVIKGVFERQPRGLHNAETIWAGDNWFTGAPDIDHAYEIKMSPEEARAMKRSGALSAAVLFRPQAPFYAVAESATSPTINVPVDRRTRLQYIIGDISALVLFDSAGDVFAIRPLR